MTFSRKVYALTGSDRANFLQGLITNNIRKTADGLVYAALLSPQGKFLADFFFAEIGETLLLDIHSDAAPKILPKLMMYKLRADVQFAESPLQVSRGTGPAPEGALADPRHPALGWRLYAPEALPEDETDWDALRVAHLIPEYGIELNDDSYILEQGFERLQGVDFKKGCYVGQEVTARMKHKTDLRKGLAKVQIDGQAPVGTPILTEDGREAGTLYTQAGSEALAFLRFERAAGVMRAGEARITKI